MGLIWVWLERLAEEISVQPSIAMTMLLSVALIVWGNGVVLCSQSVLRRRGKRDSELITLVAHTAAALVSFVLSLWVGFTAKDLGLAEPRFGRPHWLVVGFLVILALVVIVFTAFGVARHRNERDGVWRVMVTRLLIGTAGGEEFLFRGFLLAIWAGSGRSNSTIIVANMLTFGLWHVMGARKEGRFHWGDVLGPGAFAFIFVAARLAFDSLLLPWLFHAAINLPGLVLDLKGPRRGTSRMLST